MEGRAHREQGGVSWEAVKLENVPGVDRPAGETSLLKEGDGLSAAVNLYPGPQHLVMGVEVA